MKSSVCTSSDIECYLAFNMYNDCRSIIVHYVLFQLFGFDKIIYLTSEVFFFDHDYEKVFFLLFSGLH